MDVADWLRDLGLEQYAPAFGNSTNFAPGIWSAI
jgi:hypothetical protein